MKRLPVIVPAASVALLFCSMIIRHDVEDARYLALGRRFPGLVHFPMGEGSLIATQWVLTAGHLGQDLKRDIAEGYSPKATVAGQELAIEQVFVHPAFVPIENDIALVKLKEQVKDIVPARLPSSDLNEVDKEVLLVGMGDVGNGLTGPQKWDKQTRGATNKVDAVDEHWIHFRFDAPGDPRVTELEGISGPGDSGGPALLQDGDEFVIVGISSNQTGDKGRGRYGQVEHYTRVGRYLDWIRATMGPAER